MIAGRILLQSDIESVTAEMRDIFEEHGAESFALADHHHEKLENRLPDVIDGLSSQQQSTEDSYMDKLQSCQVKLVCGSLTEESSAAFSGACQSRRSVISD